MNVINSHEFLNITYGAMHSHDFWEIVIYTEGSCRTHIGDQEFLVKKRSGLLVKKLFHLRILQKILGKDSYFPVRRYKLMRRKLRS